MSKSSDIKSQVKIAVFNAIVALKKEQKEGKKAAEKAEANGAAPTPQTTPTLKAVKMENEELASVALALKTEYNLDEKAMDAILKKCEGARELCEMEVEDLANDANIIVQEVATDIAKFTMETVLNLDLSPITEHTYIGLKTPQEIKTLVTGAEKKVKIMKKKIFAKLKDDKTDEHILEQFVDFNKSVMYIQRYILILKKFLNEPSTSNQTVLLTLFITATSLTNILSKMLVTIVKA